MKLSVDLLKFEGMKMQLLFTSNTNFFFRMYKFFEIHFPDFIPYKTKQQQHIQCKYKKENCQANIPICATFIEEALENQLYKLLNKSNIYG